MSRQPTGEGIEGNDTKSNINERQTRSGPDTNAILTHMIMEGEVETQNRQSLLIAKNQADHQDVAQNTSKIQQIIQQFTELGSKLFNKFEDVIEDFIAANPLPELWKKFKGLSPLMQALVCIGIFALVAGCAYASWNFIHWVWPHIIEFAIKHKDSLLEGGQKSIQVLAQTPILGSISKSIENSSSGNDEIDRSQMSNDNVLISSGSTMIVSFLTQFLAHMTSKEENIP